MANGWTEIRPVQGPTATPPGGSPFDFAFSPQSSMPATNLYLSMGLSSLSAIATTFGAVSSARAKGAYEESIARTNATIARLQAKQAIDAGNALASKKNLETRSVLGAVRAQQGASGIDVNSGSSRVVRSSIANAGATDELTIRNNAARQAWGYETEAIESGFKGQFAKLTATAEADQSLLTGGLRAVSGPLGIYTRSKIYGAGGNRLPFNLDTN